MFVRSFIRPFIHSFVHSFIHPFISNDSCYTKSRRPQGSSAAELLSSQERGALVKHVLESARAEPGDEHALEPALTLRPGQSIGESYSKKSFNFTLVLHD